MRQPAQSELTARLDRTQLHTRRPHLRHPQFEHRRHPRRRNRQRDSGRGGDAAKADETLRRVPQHNRDRRQKPEQMEADDSVIIGATRQIASVRKRPPQIRSASKAAIAPVCAVNGQSAT